jgi:cell division protein FtsL
MSTNTMISWRPENVVRQLPWRLDSKAALGFLLILATFSLVGWLYLTQASVVTTTQYRIDELRVELDQLRNQNTALNLEIAQLEKLSRIETRAQELGLGPTTNIRYLRVANYPLSPQMEYGDLRMNTSYPTSSRDPLAVPESPIFQERNASTHSLLENTTSPTSNWWVDMLDNITAWLAEEG